MLQPRPLRAGDAGAGGLLGFTISSRGMRCNARWLRSFGWLLVSKLFHAAISHSRHESIMQLKPYGAQNTTLNVRSLELGSNQNCEIPMLIFSAPKRGGGQCLVFG